MDRAIAMQNAVRVSGVMLRNEAALDDYLFGSNQAALEMPLFADDLERIAKDNLKKSPDERDKKAKVEIVGRQYTSFTIQVQRPPVEIKTNKIKKKGLMPGRYFEIHGPGGRVKITHNVEVMQKAKRQGIHVQTKYQLPDGDTPVTKGIYDAQNVKRIEPLSNRDIINTQSQEFRASLQKFLNGLEVHLGRFRVSAR